MRGAARGLGAFAGVAHRSEPPRISALQRRSHRGIAVGAGSTAEVFGFQRGKGIAESRASGQPRDDMEPRVAVGEVKRGVELGAVGLQVVAAEAAALVLHIPRHRGPEVSIIKRARPVPRDLVKAVGHARLIQPFFGQRGPTADRRPLPIFEENRRSVGIFGQFAGARGDDECGIPIHRQPPAGVVNRRRQQFAPRHLPKARVCSAQPIDHTRHGNCRSTLHVAVAFDMLPREQIARLAAPAERIVRRVKRAGAAHAVVQCVGLTFFRAPKHHCPAARRAAHPRFQHADNE